ncbi:MAG: hypothetical protein RJA37_1681, partial [Verrucomicrobiota bacterium]
MKHLFFRLQPRERVMAVAAAGVAAFLWSTAAWERARGEWDAAEGLDTVAGVQQGWIGREKEIRAAAAEAMQGLEAGRGYDEARLVAEAVQAAKDAGLNASTDAPKSQKAGKFAIHSLQMNCRRADLGSVVRFYENVSPRAPYLALGNFSLQADRGDAGTVSVNMQITALE